MSLSKSIITTLAFVLLISSLIACGRKLAHRDSEPEGPAAAVQTRIYAGIGMVKGVDPKLPSIEIAHEDIKGLMPAMQMQFHVKDKTLLEGLQIGDRVEFTVESGVGGLLITQIHKLS